MVNIVISPSQQSWNKCAMGDSENEHCHEIGIAVFNLLQQYNCNTYLIHPMFGTEAQTLSEAVRQSNMFVAQNPAEKSYHLCIHTDAGYKASGASGFYLSESGKGFITQIWREISKLTPWGDGNISYRKLYELFETDAVAGLIEISFHDNAEEAKWIHMNIDNIAQAIVKGLVITTGISEKEEAKHWAEDSYRKLLANGCKINERRFDEPLTRGEAFVLLAQKLK